MCSASLRSPSADAEIRLPLARARFLQTRLIWAYRDRILPEHRSIQSHDLGCVSARLYLRGGGVFSKGSQRVEVGIGQWLFAPEESYHHSVQPESDYYSVRFRAHWSTGRRLFPSGEFLVVSAAEAPGLTDSARDLVQLISEHLPGARHRLAGHSVGLAVWAELQERFAGWMRHYIELMERLGVAASVPWVGDERVARALAAIEDALPGAAPTLQETARRVGCGRNHLARLFEREAGSSYRAVADRMRLERVVELLEEQGLGIKQAAYAAGFASLPHFSRWFQRQTGSTPRAYQQRIARSPV